MYPSLVIFLPFQPYCHFVIQYFLFPVPNKNDFPWGHIPLSNVYPSTPFYHLPILYPLKDFYQENFFRNVIENHFPSGRPEYKPTSLLRVAVHYPYQKSQMRSYDLLPAARSLFPPAPDYHSFLYYVKYPVLQAVLPTVKVHTNIRIIVTQEISDLGFRSSIHFILFFFHHQCPLIIFSRCHKE